MPPPRAQWCRDHASAVATRAGGCASAVAVPCRCQCKARWCNASATAACVGAVAVPRQCHGNSRWCNDGAAPWPCRCRGRAGVVAGTVAVPCRCGAGAVALRCPRVPAHTPLRHGSAVAGRVLISPCDAPTPSGHTGPWGSLSRDGGLSLVPPTRCPPHAPHPVLPPRPPCAPPASPSRVAIARPASSVGPGGPHRCPPPLRHLPRATPTPRPPGPRASLPPPKHIPHGSRSCPCPRASSLAGTWPSTAPARPGSARRAPRVVPHYAGCRGGPRPASLNVGARAGGAAEPP